MIAAATVVAAVTQDSNADDQRNYGVYTLRDRPTDDVLYVGITRRDMDVRFNEHLRDPDKEGFDFRIQPEARGLTYPQARAVEQDLIERYGGAQSMGGRLLNKINSVSPRSEAAGVYQRMADYLMNMVVP